MRVVFVVLAALALAAPAVLAQTSPVKRTDLQEVDYPNGYITSMITVEFPPNHVVAPHTHPGAEVIYVLEGEMTITLAGKDPRKVKAGDSLNIPANTVHQGTMGPAGVKLLNTFVLEKGKPRNSPAP
jgi:quercetin dioxygenase-like cupin family protein